MLNLREEAGEVSAALRQRWASPRQRKVALLLLAVVLLLVVLLVRNIQHRHAAAMQGPGGGRGGLNNPVAVTVATVTSGDVQVRIPALGTITPLATVTVKTQISGLLQKIAFKEGQLVRQGDFLAQIDPRPYEAALKQIRGTLRRDQALLGDANGIVVITQLQPITAIFSVPEDDVTTIMRRLHDGATLQAEAYDRTNSTRLATGKLLTVDNQIDT